ncbi:MAG: DNA polymerase III subunit gamma/tau [Pseudomonadota bacterium]|nr:DNA polymerase III subunit gamma/tau [Pseudomonadota bacterium]MEC8216248.1 DNA polymerase III subunit gamma/tau [Pseudomonadota bacterium]MEC8269971.1 DNA polymerase III subunit gamma/tau [Pseudomonadota bacterium]
MNDSILTGYRVLARTYRPERFSELIGQDALVRTLQNALSLGRLAHAFVLTGVRGVGKTSTARLLARGLNCIGSDGEGGPTLEPCGVCEPCRSIAAGYHVDVLEIDAASHTGVDDAREIIEGVGYRPVSGRYKIYIIDEVHMMSKSAFNALLKTLEEPPNNVKFIFATTEIRKVPVTILSRCQRFDLRRVSTEQLATHLQSICERESISADSEAITAIARAAEGSVRDSLSLLDQAAAMTADRLTIDSVTEMLGRPGRSDSIAILDAAMRGDAASALAALAGSLAGGAEPDMILSDLLDLVHRASLKAAGGAMDTLLESEVEAIEALSGLGIARLGRAWQMLLKGHGEIASAPQPPAAAEMLVIRLSHLANMPTPGDIVRRLAGTDSESGATAAAPSNGTASPPHSEPADTTPPVARAAAGGDQAPPVTDPMPSPAPVPEADPTAPPQPSSLLEISELAEENGDPMLAAHVRNHVRLVRMQPGLLDISLTDGAPESLAGDMARRLSDWAGQRWMVSLSDGPGGQTIAEERRAAKQRQMEVIAETSLVKSITETFPGATIETVTPAEQQDEEFPT